MPLQLALLATLLVFVHAVCYGRTVAAPTADTPLTVQPAAKTVQVYGIIRPRRFNAADGGQARYHLLVWKGGRSPGALIETPADDLAFHEALARLGAKPGDNLGMASWDDRHDPRSPAPREKVTGSKLNVRISWKGNAEGVSIDQAFHQLPSRVSDAGPPTPDAGLTWRFGGNRDRWFNRVPLALRPGCLVCLYSCPSGKVSNDSLSIHDYVTSPARFEADTALLPPDGTPVVVTFRLSS